MRKIINPSKKNINNEVGATSIFVLIFMVVLLVFGVAALTTSLAGLKLADKNHIWSEEYYMLEGNAQIQVANIDALLYKSEVNARNYIMNHRFLEATSSDIYGENQERINSLWLNQVDISNQEAFLEQLIQYIYYYQLLIQIPSILDDYEKVSFDDWMKGRNNPQLPKIKFSVKEEKPAYPKNIDVELKLLIPIYNIYINTNGEITGVRDGKYLQRYEIVKWKEWQKPFIYTDDINFENPNFETPDFINENSSEEIVNSTENDNSIFNESSDTENNNGIIK